MARTMSRYRTDLWRVGILRAPIEACLNGWPEAEIVWLPDPGPYRFLADPFGVWRDGELHVFVEAYDYRDKKGRLVRHVYDAELNWRDSAPVMEQRFHLSYPFLISSGEGVYMLPEAHRSGKLALYHSQDLLHWENAADLLDLPAIDASVIEYEGRWWMFYSLPGSEQESLHVAYADALRGPWHPHSANPVFTDRGGARPGGTPVVIDGTLHLPTQDCRETYGGAIRWLRIDKLTPQTFRATPGARLSAGAWAAPYMEGLHTLSACGPVTLFDVKRIDCSPKRALINLQRRWRRLTG